MIYAFILFNAFLSLALGEGYIYYGDPADFRTYYQAELYCELTHGTTLATIITEEDRARAIEEIDGGAAPFFGLYSIVSDGWWIFQETQDTCPDTTTGRCIDFWLYSKHNVPQPRCIDDGSGYYCATFYSTVNGADNDQDCMIPGPFMCNSGTGYESRGYVTDGNVWLYWNDAQQACQDNYGTDLATIRTQADFDEALAVLDAANVPAAWIGLNDRAIEGQFVWVDGSDCEPNNEIADGLCTEFWMDNIPDNIDDTNGYNDADCVFINTDYGPGFHREINCELQEGWAYLCNLPVEPIPQAKAIGTDLMDGVVHSKNRHLHKSNHGNHINYYAYYKVLIINVIVTVVFCVFAIWMVYYCCFKRKNAAKGDTKYDAVKDETTEVEEI